MKARLKILLIIFSLLVLYSVYYWGIPAILNLSSNVELIQKNINKELGFDVEIKSPKFKMGILPAIWLEANEFKILGKKKPPFVVEEPKLKLALFPLFVKRIHVLNFNCKNIDAEFRLDNKNRIFIGNYMLIKLSDSKFNIDDAKINILKYKIKFKDEKFNKLVFLKGNYFIVDEFNPNGKIKFATDSKITINNKTSSINARVEMSLPIKKNFSSDNFIIQGSITNLDLNEISPYISLVSKNYVRLIKGILNAEALTQTLTSKKHKLITKLTFEKGLVTFKNIGDVIIFPQKVNFSSEVELLKQKIVINKFNFNSEKLAFKLFGNISKIQEQTPIFDLKLNILPSHSEALISMLPSINFPDIDIKIPLLKKYGFYSQFEGELDISGKFSEPKIYGNMIISDAYIYKPLDIDRAVIKLKFNGDNLDLDADVPVNESEHVFVKGTINFYDDKNVVLSIKSTPNVDLAIVEFILLPLHEVLDFPLGPVPVMDIKGFGNIDLTTGGNKLEPKLYGLFNFNDAQVKFNDLNCLIEKGSGLLKFDEQDFYFITKSAFLDSKPLKIEGNCTAKGDLDFNITSSSLNLNKLINVLKTSLMLKDFKKSVDKIEATSGNIALKLNLKGKAKDMSEFIIGKNITVSGDIKLLENDILITNIQSKLKKMLGNIHFKNNEVNFDLYPNLSNKRYQIKGKMIDNKIFTKVKLDDMSFICHDIPIKIYSGMLEVDGDKLGINKVNGVMDSKPVFISGSVYNLLSEPEIDIYFNSKPKQSFIDKYLNKNNIYPLIIKGDVSYSARFSGPLKDLNVKSQIKLQEASSIYYMGAELGDALNPINIFIEMNLSKDVIDLKNFQYNKLITSQNNREYVSPQLMAKGGISLKDKNNLKFNNFRIKTFAPTDAKIFNIIFKKIFIKQGLFESNIVLNGSFPDLKILGKLDYNNIDIPFLEMTVKNISLLFKDKFVDFSSNGDIFSQEFKFSGIFENKLSPPFIINEAEFNSGRIDLNKITRKINNIEIESNMNKIGSEQKVNFDLKNILVKKMKVKTKFIHIKNVLASDLLADLSLKNGELDINHFKFNAAEGIIDGSFKSNLVTSNTSLNLRINSVNANTITEALLNLSNQLYGSLNGELDISYSGRTYQGCMKTLSGKGGFRVVNGRMPKLGSLEYLLKAANLVKSGLTGITINSLIDLVTPLKTGEFKNINGIFSIKSGIADDIQIFSKGKDLSIFITGKYNCYESTADMQVYGKVSKKISNVLGIFGNTSINTLFNTIPGMNLDLTNKASFVSNINKIPGIELNEKDYRLFSATVKGDLNSENYVQSFKWIE